MYTSWPPVNDVPEVCQPYEQSQAARVDREIDRMAKLRAREEVDRGETRRRSAEQAVQRRREYGHHYRIKRRGGHQPRPVRKPVVCLDTGEEFPSVLAAATAHKIHKGALRASLRERRKTRGWVNGERRWLTFRPAGEPIELAPVGGRARAVLCLSTGKRFPSVTEAVQRKGQSRRDFKRRHRALMRSIEGGRSFEGRRWAWLSGLGTPSRIAG